MRLYPALWSPFFCSVESCIPNCVRSNCHLVPTKSILSRFQFFHYLGSLTCVIINALLPRYDLPLPQAAACRTNRMVGVVVLYYEIIFLRHHLLKGARGHPAGAPFYCNISYAPVSPANVLIATLIWSGRSGQTAMIRASSGCFCRVLSRLVEESFCS